MSDLISHHEEHHDAEFGLKQEVARLEARVVELEEALERAAAEARTLFMFDLEARILAALEGREP